MQNARDLAANEATENLVDRRDDQGSGIYQRLSAALTDDATLGGGRSLPAATEAVRRRLSPADRESMTQRSVVAVLEQLTFTSERLQNAMQRVGYLECQVEVLQDTVSQMPDLRHKATRAIILEREKEALDMVLEERNQQLRRREKQLESKDREIEILLKILEAHKKHATQVEADLQNLEQKPWVRFFAWFTGAALSKWAS